jgi:histidinol-phosphate aminotransferase
MGLLDYYRQFEDIDQSEVNVGLRERRAREKALALERVPVLDLSGTEWPESPNADVVSASVYQARGRLNGYPDHYATPVRRALAERHYIRGEQIVVGNGASDLIKTAAYLLLSEGSELVTPWPSHPLFPSIAARAGARTVEVELAAGAPDPEALLAAVTERTRVVALCNPNDPTGGYVDSARVAELASRLPEHVHLFLDEAYIQFQDVESEDACLRLVELFPRLLVFRTFSKAYGLSGLRAGYVIGSAAGTSFVASLAPMLGVNTLTQAAVLKALKIGDRDVQRRRALVLEQRARLYEGLAALPVEAPPSQANFVWLRAEGLTGEELAARLEQARVRVTPGGLLGDETCVRAAVRDERATDRLLWALRETLGERDPRQDPERTEQASAL